jgi:RNA-directed DNA polymerase
VICCHAGADEALVKMRNMMSRLKVRVNDSKTRVCKLPEDKFDFLGYPCEATSERTRRSPTPQDVGMVIEALNRKINGWANYFCLGPVR